MSKKELLEMKDLKVNSSEYLYPSLNDSEFNLKIASKKEFYDNQYNGEIVEDIEKHSDMLCNVDFELAPHQLFVKNFLSFHTPYNTLLLYHGLGSGKTCSAISIAEEQRIYMNQVGQTKRIIIVASPNVQENFKTQLFDERKLKFEGGRWNLNNCVGNNLLKEVNAIKSTMISKEKIIKKVKQIIKTSYLFLGYIEFANYIEETYKVTDPSIKDKQKKILEEKKLQKTFDNRLVIIDEIHNIRMSDENKNKRVAVELYKLVEYTNNMRLLLLSATPMYDNYLEIIWLVNIMNLNDNRSTIKQKDVFTKNGSFVINDGKEVGKDLLKRKMNGYVSYIRGENPYTFPYRIYPTLFNKSKSISSVNYPTIQFNGDTILQKIEFIDLYITNIGNYQNIGYDYIIRNLADVNDNISLGYTTLLSPLEALNMVYPSLKFDETIKDDTSEIKFDFKQLIGKIGLNSTMIYNETMKPLFKGNFEYRPEILENYGRIFSPEEIGKYSNKINSICESIKKSDGIVLVYSQYIDGGLIPIALALEEMGFTRYGDSNSLFKNPPREPIDAITKKRKKEGKEFNPAKYAMITGDKMLSIDNAKEINALTSSDNINGEKIKVVFISKAGSEGLDFKNIRQIHVMEPWYNMNRIEQIIGRGIRTCSHKQLPFSKRNIEIYLHTTNLSNRFEAVDLYVYRIAERKSLQIGRITRLMKKIAVDCILNFNQQQFTEENMQMTVKQRLSSGEKIKYKIGDKPFSSICDYMEKCNFVCSPDKKIKDLVINYDTYDESYLLINIDKILNKIKNLFKEHFFYKKKEIVSLLNRNKQYPIEQINSALDILVNDVNEFVVDKYDRLGFVINIDKYYIFQPKEINNKNISVFERSVPVDYKKTNLVIKQDKEKKLDEDIEDIKKQKIVVETKKTVFDIKDVYKIMQNMKVNYNLATTKNEIVRGENNWYKFFSVWKVKLEANGFDGNLINEILLEHLVDNLTYSNKRKILDYLFYKKDLDDFEIKIKRVFDNNIIDNGEIKALLLNENGGQKMIILDESIWKNAESQDYADLKSELVKLIIKNFNSVIGYITDFKKEEMIFKVKDLTVKGQKGARCDQSGKAEALKILNKILETDKYNSKNTKNVQLDICCAQELYLRYFDKTKKDGKRWFIKESEVIINKL